MDADKLQGALAEYFAPWVQALGLRVESHGPGQVTLRLPRGRYVAEEYVALFESKGWQTP